jgi:SET domain-containing protein
LSNWRRILIYSNIISDTIYGKLAPSVLGGIGVFATKDILKGTPVFIFHDLSNEKRLSKKDINNLPDDEKELYHEHAVVLPDGSWVVPSDMHRMHVVWFLNHSSNPNIAPDNKFDWYAVQDIKKGEELTGDYNAWDAEGTNGFTVKENA